MGCNVRDYMQQLLTVPDTASVNAAMTVLRDISAVDASESIVTALGRHLADLPLDLRLGKVFIQF